MRTLVAPDKFKGTFSAEQVAAAIAAGLDGEVDLCPIADGGEGTAAILCDALGGEWVQASATDALGRPVDCRYAVLASGAEAVIEVAEASGLWRLEAGELDPVAASSAGTGELIADAIGRGARRVTVACGGSATTDGGVGALSRFDPTQLDQLVCLCDTNYAFTAAAAVFAPQKGANQAQVDALGERLAELADSLPHDPRRLPFTGAAGGLSGGFWAHGARLVPGARSVLDLLDFDQRLAGADRVITGEGGLDATSFSGKALGEVLSRAVARTTPAHAIVGSRAEGLPETANGFASISVAGDEAAIRAAASRLR